jgi:hypothetical protein
VGLWLVTASSTPAQQQATSPLAVPRAEIETTEIDLGTLDRGSKATARFEVRNAGEAELRILQVKPG